MEDVTELLLELDQIIPAFDAYIGHSHTGFRVWVKKHQRAMEHGLASIPTWPQLHRVVDGRFQWLGYKWEQRYRYLVRYRDILTRKRLLQVKCCTQSDIDAFFGLTDELPRETFLGPRVGGGKSKKSRTRMLGLTPRLGDLWYLPLNALLTIVGYASKWELDADEVQRQFWGDSYGRACAHDFRQPSILAK